MRRETSAERPGWRRKCEAVGFSFHSMDGVYWDETACYRFSAKEIDELEDAANEVHRLCLAAVDELIAGSAYSALAIPQTCAPMIKASWERRDFSLFGRFDFSYDGRTPPKLLEYNADTPTALLEAAVVQWHWLQDVHPEADQFNSIHERLIAAWRTLRDHLPPGVPLHLACDPDSEEDFGNAEYLRDTALQAGLDARSIAIKDIGWTGGASPLSAGSFVDLNNQRIGALFKLYPWEWLVREDFGRHIPRSGATFIEPAWKMLLSNKGLLAALWELNPGHPNLLEAYIEPGRISRPYVRKPLLSREGANITIHTAGEPELSTPGTYGDEGWVYQAYHALPDFDGKRPVVGAWIVGDEAAGIGIREDSGPVTTNASHFLPHYFEP